MDESRDTYAKMRTENFFLSSKTQSSPKNGSRQKCLEISLTQASVLTNLVIKSANPVPSTQ